MMSNMASKLKPMDMALKDESIVHLIFASLPKEYKSFVVNYNLWPEKWDIEKLIAMCVQEEESLKGSHGDSINHMKQNKRKSFHNKKAKPQGKPQWANGSSSKPYGKAPRNDHHQKSDHDEVDKDVYMWCKKKGHYQKDCPEFLKYFIRKGEDIITFVDESLYLSYTKFLLNIVYMWFLIKINEAYSSFDFFYNSNLSIVVAFQP
jgi:hypothetical protein